MTVAQRLRGCKGLVGWGMDLDAAMTPVRTGERTFAWDVPDGWQQGRGAFGGLVAGAIIGAGEAVLAGSAAEARGASGIDDTGSGRPLRALTLEIMAPVVVGAAAIEVVPLRAGSSVAVARAELRVGAEVCAHAVLTFGRDRDEPDWQAAAPPDLPPAASMEPVMTAAPPAPIFTRHMEYRTTGGTPFSGPPTRELVGWVRPRTPGAARGAGYLAACVDAYWPVAIIGGTTFRPAATLTFTMMITGDLRGVAADAPLAYRARGLASGAGYMPELRELWTPDGRLVAVNPQTFALSR